MDAMSKKERLARGSAVIKVMKVNPRPGHFLKSYIDPRKLPKRPSTLRGMLAEMPHLDIKGAVYEFSPKSAKVPGFIDLGNKQVDCGSTGDDEKDPSKIGLPDGDKMMNWYSYKIWQNQVNPSADGNLSEHFNVMLGLLISMAMDPDNENFADAEAYPCVQFLRMIKTPDGKVPFNCAAFIFYIDYVCQKMIDEG